MTDKKKNSEVNFEKSLEQLEASVRKLESGTLTLDDSLKVFEEGIVWSRQCESALTAAQGKIEKLIQKENGSVLSEPYSIQDDTIKGPK